MCEISLREFRSAAGLRSALDLDGCASGDEAGRALLSSRGCGVGGAWVCLHSSPAALMRKAAVVWYGMV